MSCVRIFAGPRYAYLDEKGNGEKKEWTVFYTYKLLVASVFKFQHLRVKGGNSKE